MPVEFFQGSKIDTMQAFSVQSNHAQSANWLFSLPSPPPSALSCQEVAPAAMLALAEWESDATAAACTGSLQEKAKGKENLNFEKPRPRAE